MSAIPLPTVLARPRLITPQRLQTVDLMVLIRRAEPGYAWGISSHLDGEDPARWDGGEAGSLHMLESAIKGSIHKAAHTWPEHEIVVDTSGEKQLWAEIALRLPDRARMKDLVEKVHGDPRPYWKANSICPGVITGLDIDIATDGSVGRLTGHAGFGWISSDGAFGVGMLGQNRDVCFAELSAINSALKRVTRSSKVRVLVDSTEAIDLVNRRVDLGPSSVATNRKRLALLEQIDRSPVRQVSIEKVAAHTGHILNEGADRLAKLGRRASEAGMSNERLWGTAIHIRTEVIEELRRHRA